MVRVVSEEEVLEGTKSQELGEGGGNSNTQHYTVTTRMTPAFRWAAMRVAFNVSLIMRDKVTVTTVSTDHNF